MTSSWPLAVVVLMTSLTYCVTEFTLTVLHTNDVHARYEQFNQFGSQCSADDDSKGLCFGGYARLATAVKSLRQQYPNSLFLDGGDQYQGTLWFYKYGDNITSHMMNWVRYDVMAIGNHEFDRTVEGLLPFLRAVNFPVISANIDASNVSSMQGLYNKSVVKTVGGHKIGIVGYTTVDTTLISEPGPYLIFNDVVQSVTAEVERLRASGINIIIALGHAGYSMDLEVGKIPGVDIVVGGHTDTFLYTGTQPSNEKPVNVYPTVVQRTDGKALVVQDFTWAKYLGILHVTFDDNGNVLNYSGNPQLQNSSVLPDPATVQQLLPYKLGLQAMANEVIGRSLVKLEGDRTVCRARECNLGNMIADAMVFQNLKHPDEKRWSDVSIGLINGGSVRASVQRGNITVGDIMSVMPFSNTIDTGELKGKYLRQAFEHSVERLDPNNLSDLFGGFLQISGMTVSYDMRKPVGQRVVSLAALCTACEIPKYEPVEPERVYKIVLSSFMARGGDGYTVIDENIQNHDIIGDLDSDVFMQYVKAMTPLYHGEEGRITFVDGSNDCTGAAAPTAAVTCPLLLLLAVWSVAL